MSAELRIEAADRVLILAPHPDDEALACAGLIQRVLRAGAALCVVYLTDGDDNPWPQRVLERRWRIGAEGRARWGARRRAEALAGLAVLGVSAERTRFLGYPDGHLAELLLRDERPLCEALAVLIRAFAPTMVVSASPGDSHADHAASAVFLALALDEAECSPSAIRQYHYCVHGRCARGDRSRARRLELQPGEIERKRAAIACHASQLVLSRRRFMAYARASEEFLEGGASALANMAHQLEDTDWTAGGIRVMADAPRWLRPWAPARVELLGLTGSGVRVQGLEVPVPRRGGRALVREVPGARALGGVRCETRGGRIEMDIPASWLAGAAARWYVRLCYAAPWRIDSGGWVSLRRTEISAAGEEKLVLPKVERVCLIPCYNVAEYCAPVIRGALEQADRVVVVDDGSGDGTERLVREIADEANGRLEVLRLAENAGKGVALMTGWRHALANWRFEVLLTLDGDGQHRPEDIPLLADAVVGGAAMAIGERSTRTMPLRSLLGNVLITALVRARYRRCPRDTQSGFRAFSAPALRRIVAGVAGRRYETELHVLLLALTEGWSIARVTIPTIYIAGNRSSHFRPLLDSLRVVRALLPRSASDDRGAGPTPLVYRGASAAPARVVAAAGAARRHTGQP